MTVGDGDLAGSINLTAPSIPYYQAGPKQGITLSSIYYINLHGDTWTDASSGIVRDDTVANDGAFLSFHTKRSGIILPNSFNSEPRWWEGASFDKEGTLGTSTGSDFYLIPFGDNNGNGSNRRRPYDFWITRHDGTFHFGANDSVFIPAVANIDTLYADSIATSNGASVAKNMTIGGTLNVTGATTLSKNLGINTPEVSTSNIIDINNNKSANIFTFEDTLANIRLQEDSTWRIGFEGAPVTTDEIVIRNTKNLATILDLRNSSNTTLDLFDSLGIAHIGGNTGTTTTDMEISNQQFRAYFVKMKSQSGNADKLDIDSSGIVTTLHGFTMDGGNGVIGTPDTISWTAQTTSISSKNFSNTATGHLYRFTYYVSTTTTSTSGGTISISTAWNDGVAQTFTSGTALLSATGVTGMIGGTEEMYVASGVPTWSTTISGVIVGSPQYQVRAALEMIW